MSRLPLVRPSPATSGAPAATRQRSPWVLALVLSLGAAAVIGLARFAYALVLPAMRNDLHWSYAQAGALGAANALGYLAGALLTMRLVQRWGNRRLFVVGLALTAVALVAGGLTHDHGAQLGWRALAGVGAAGTFICGGVLAGTLTLTFGGKVRPGLGVTVFFAGGGLGILASGVALPFWLAATGDGGWPGTWLAMGAVALAVTIAGAEAARHIAEPGRRDQRATWPVRDYRALLASYLLFGLGYIAYMTFIVAWMRQSGGTPGEVAFTWAVLGVANIVAPLAWGDRFRRARGGRSMAEALALFAAGAMLPLIVPGAMALAASALLVGGSVFMVPSAVTLVVRDELPPAAWGPALAVFTTVFAAGQVIGPMLTGWLADATGSLFAGLALSAAILVASSLAARAQRPGTASR